MDIFTLMVQGFTKFSRQKACFLTRVIKKITINY